MASKDVPQLTGPALQAVRHRGSHVQIIAAAGSGKTEVVSQRVADLLAEGVAPEAIMAFTFTERAAQELKERIVQRVAARLGSEGVDRLNGLFVGTIHAFCFRFLQQRAPKYETFDVLDDKQLTAFLSREAHRLGIRQFDDRNRLFASIQAFLRSVDVVENELIDPADVPDPFGSVLRDYYTTLDRYRLLTYGQQIVRTVHELERPELAADVHETLRHLIVDEYQDVNPAQERLIRLLAGPGVQLCVVGDDQQAIYQWRGSDVRSIVKFPDRFTGVETFQITTNRRSRPTIIKVANEFGATIVERIPKQMLPHRESASSAAEVAVWTAETETDEARRIAEMIVDLHTSGVPYRDMAVLVRGRTAYPRLLEQFGEAGVPVQPGGRTGLFSQPEARVLGRTFAWLTDVEWHDGFGPSERIGDAALEGELVNVFGLVPVQRAAVGRFLFDWKKDVSVEMPSNLIAEFYDLLDKLGVRAWNLADPLMINRLGTLARFSSLLVDYESVRQRARPDAEAPGEQVGGERGGPWYYKNLAYHVLNYAAGAYEGFDGEADLVLDAVDLTTIHRAKGLEWPVVFMPSMTNRFPPARTGRPQDWLLPRTMFGAERYEGCDDDERRLFYVAITRARDWLSVSRHERVTKRSAGHSPYHQELADYEVPPDKVTPTVVDVVSSVDDEVITISYSQLASFMDCGLAYRLRERIGFQPRLAPELGFGKAVHHVMREIAEATRRFDHVPSAAQIDEIIGASFFLPTANKAAHRQMRGAARKLVGDYAWKYEADLHRVWETERPFELHLDGVTISGRADVILDREGGTAESYAIVDYKTSTSGDTSQHELQLQVYVDAGRREGLDVRAAYVHDLKADDTERPGRQEIDVDAKTISAAEARVSVAASRVKARDFAPNAGPRCRTCEVRTICRYAKA